MRDFNEKKKATGVILVSFIFMIMYALSFALIMTRFKFERLESRIKAGNI